MTLFDIQSPPLARLQNWYRSPLGQEAARIECASVQRLLANTFGYYLIQVGVIETFRDALAASRIRHRILIPGEVQDAPTAVQPWPQILARADQLPLASDSVDAILLPHTLDFAADPLAVLSEVERILIPAGRVVILGFNAMRAWGGRGLIERARGRAPWCGRFRTAAQTAKRLSALGFDIEVCEHMMYRLPFRRTLCARCEPFESWGPRFLPRLGGIYVLRAVKRVATLTPLKPSWFGRRRTILAGGAMRPTRRGTGHV